MASVELICFGNELLIGKTVNTNAHWLGKQISILGSTITRITTVPDILDEMVKVLQETINRKPNIIITTGGLGPTFDDLTLDALAKATNTKLVLNEKAVELIKERLDELSKVRGIILEFTIERKKMALIPEGADALKNRAGSAPGVMLRYGETLIFSLPGVPSEMMAIFEYEISKFFENEEQKHLLERTLIVKNIPESELAKAISPIRLKYPAIYFKTHPKSYTIEDKRVLQVEVHLTEIGTTAEEVVITQAEKEIIDILLQMQGVNGEKPIINTLEKI